MKILLSYYIHLIQCLFKNHLKSENYPSGESVIGEHDTIEAEPGSSARYEVCYVEAVVFFAPGVEELVSRLSTGKQV